MNFKALDVIENQKQQQAQTSLKRWRELLNRMIGKDDLTDDEAGELALLHEQIRPALPPLREYAALAVERIGKRSATKRLADAEAALTKASKAEVDHEETGKALKARHESEQQAYRDKTNELTSATLSANSRLDQARAAQDELAKLEAGLWQLLGTNDPEVLAAQQAEHDAREANRRHICHHWNQCGDRYRDAKYPVVYFELLLGNQNVSWGDLSKVEFIPLPDQVDGDERSDFEYMVSIARDASCGLGLPWKYLTDEADCNFFRSLQYSHETAAFVFQEETKRGGKFDPSIYRWLLYPGQTQEKLDKLVAKLQRAHDTRGEGMPDDWIEDQRAGRQTVGGVPRSNVIRMS